MLIVMNFTRAATVSIFAIAALVASSCGGGGEGNESVASTTASPGATTTTASGGPAITFTTPSGGLPECVAPGSAPTSKDFPPSADPARGVPAEQREKINAVAAGLDFFVGENNFVFGIVDLKNQPIGGAKTRVTFYDLADPKNPRPVCQGEAVQSAPGVGPLTQHIHGTGELHPHGGEDDARVGYFIRVKFDHAGTWGLAVEAILKDGTKGVSNVSIRVTDKAQIPAPGDLAPKSDNLTRKDVARIEEIDSGDPPNDMHEVKIKDAIAAGRALVVVFSTPAYCTSLFCGPVNQEVEALYDIYKGQVDFVHIEIWRDRAKQVLNPTAQEWLSRQDGSLIEPYVYVIDRTGVIYNRWEGPAARNIMEESVKAVAGGATFK
jgi:hypothetical protein